MADDTSAAATNIGQVAGAALEALPIDRMIAGPMIAAQKAQTMMSTSYAAFIERVCLDENGNVKTVTMRRKEAQLGPNGEVVDEIEKEVEVPILALVSHPNLNIDDIEVAFNMKVSSSFEDQKSNSYEGAFEAELGWGIFSMKMSGSVSHKDAQTRKTDTSAVYDVRVKGSRSGPPEGLMKIIDWLINDACRPKVATVATPAAAPAPARRSGTTPPAAPPTSGS